MAFAPGCCEHFRRSSTGVGAVRYHASASGRTTVAGAASNQEYRNTARVGVRRSVRLRIEQQPQTEKDEPQPQVDDAFGFLITNCEPSSPSV